MAWYVESETEFCICPRSYCGLNVRLKLQIDKITHSKLTLTSMLISMVLHPLGSLQMMLYHIFQQFSFSKPLIQIWSMNSHLIGYAKILWMMSIQYLKWGVAQSRMITCVIPIFGHRKSLMPLFWARVHSTAQEIRQALIQPCSLTIRLWMV